MATGDFNRDEVFGCDNPLLPLQGSSPFLPVSFGTAPLISTPAAPKTGIVEWMKGNKVLVVTLLLLLAILTVYFYRRRMSGGRRRRNASTRREFEFVDSGDSPYYDEASENSSKKRLGKSKHASRRAREV